MEKMTLDMLNEAARRGGSSALTEVGELRPAAGPHALVSPAKYTTKAGVPTYVFETRFIDGAPTKTVLIDSRTSTANRLEEGIAAACEEGNPVFGVMPKIQVTYSADGREKTFCDFQLPHRAFDGHVRLGNSVSEGVPMKESRRYAEARYSSPSSAGGLLELSPVTVLFGGWDSTRKNQQARFPSAVVGEIIGILADQESRPDSVITKRSGARIDPFSASITYDGEKGSGQVVGAIAPGVDSLDGIATSRIIRSYVLSFATLRRLRFGKGAEGDASIRALLAAMALDLIARNDCELFLRANAHLVEAAPPQVTMDCRYGKAGRVLPMSIREADALLEAAYVQAEEIAHLNWEGQVFEVEGNPDFVMAAEAEKEA